MSTMNMRAPGLARKRGAPPGLSIVAPSPQQFATERVIQAANMAQPATLAPALLSTAWRQ
ncbi:uncharacterized protein B0T15DRAFT_497538 [Chaetomium strumarium]|uniref:Uncharacterized protein n=1 Tax=Chaetomium strumarium TaxID=1170767 RepID=A0AAJ0GKW0_9PEZI|nr:hypothetical protein B0T15DRAFT_497538 [Chaetomium strumarium]